MKSVLMNKKTIFAILALFIFVFAIQNAEPTAAAKIVDKGSVKFYDREEKSMVKYSWKTYQYGKNYLKVKGYMYILKDNEGATVNYYLVKVTKKKLKIKATVAGEPVFTEYGKTNLTAARFYWRVFQPLMMRGKLFMD